MYKYFRPRIRSRHPSHSQLREKGSLPLFPFKSIIRFGSSTEMDDTISKGGNRIEVNTVDSVKNSSNKLLMKKCFSEYEVKTADWWTHIPGGNHFNPFDYQGENGLEPIILAENLPFPIISKHIFGSRGTGNKKHDNLESFTQWMQGKDLSKYIFEKFYNYSREYRLHVTEDGCFYTCRKMLKSDTPTEKRWYRNDDNSVWIIEENESFDKPVNWDKVVDESIKALKAVGLHIGAVDLRIQSATNKKGEKREDPDFIVVEINSAPSFGDITLDKYKQELPKLLVKLSNEK